MELIILKDQSKYNEKLQPLLSNNLVEMLGIMDIVREILDFKQF